MPASDYSGFLEQFRQQQLPYLPAELHGVLCGALAVTPAPSEAALLAQLARHVGEDIWPAAWVADWRQLRKTVIEAYQGDELALELLLPKAPGEHVVALAAWCEGFLAGFAEQGRKPLSKAVNESLNDLASISRMETPQELSEEELEYLEDIEEHCRLLAFTVFTELALQAPAGGGAS